MKNWLLVLTFFSLWLTTMFDSDIQQYLAYAIILTVGVLHGANDITLIKTISSKRGSKVRYSKVLLYYLITVLLILAVFFVYPPLALTLFILISSYHFGEQHLKQATVSSHLLSKSCYFFYGLVILFMIFTLNVNKTAPIFLEVTGFEPSPIFFGTTLAIAIVGLLISYSVLWYRKQVHLNVLEELAFLVILALVFTVADLLWAFGIYFVLWHSVPSLRDQIQLLHGKAEIQGLKTYLKTSWLYWLASIVGLVVLYLVLQGNNDYFISILVYFLAAITFPHVIVMSRIED
ncbi:15,15'-beta-carotene dioxygenase [Croceitalea dokdonensis DOKDO 023]|uniref:Probable beta-carotene 15,15'-dioxygenase n=1 Tax=Croceitalea dokdonensis DOKDO 023 TaxID=1300341 RepID=A0A0P7AI71_9FLAO|nr:Brp/Blh family beta-carotene 15,15'-dioxygenase [Croceitalea dokdonensis]KPM31457.1 15,15'-beta-carotene dioxygenase [Croceitalea dokdonensis DOKDO 023]